MLNLHLKDGILMEFTADW